jgi:hypothetical protein
MRNRSQIPAFLAKYASCQCGLRILIAASDEFGPFPIIVSKPPHDFFENGTEQKQ